MVECFSHPKLMAPLCWSVLICSLFTVLAVTTLHVVQPDLDPAARAISEYVHGRGGYLMTATFFSQAAASAAMAGLAVFVRPVSWRTRLGALLFAIAAFGAVTAGIFPADLSSVKDPTTTGAIHAAGGIARFLALAIALPLLSPSIAQPLPGKPGPTAIRKLAMAFTLTFAIAILLLANHDLFGLGQRLFIGILVLWMVLVAYHDLRGLQARSVRKSRDRAA